ncbi:hypothetical protein PENTCL1PPCAC_23925, partial [Pristionchus entomophagus]
IFYSGILQPHIYYPTGTIYEGGGAGLQPAGSNLQQPRGVAAGAAAAARSRLVELAAGLGATAQHHRRVHSARHVHHLQEYVPGAGALVLDVDLAENLLAIDDDNGGRDVALVVSDVHRVPLLLAERRRLLVRNPSVVETAHVLGQLEQDLDGSDVGLELLAVPREVGRDLATLVPDRTHDGLSSLVPQRDVLVGVLAGESVERLVERLDHLARGPRVAGTEVGPFVEHDTDDGLGRQLGAHWALAVGGSALELAHDDHHVAEFACKLLLRDAIVREARDLSLVVDVA